MIILQCTAVHRSAQCVLSVNEWVRAVRDTNTAHAHTAFDMTVCLVRCALVRRGEAMRGEARRGAAGSGLWM